MKNIYFLLLFTVASCTQNKRDEKENTLTQIPQNQKVGEIKIPTTSSSGEMINIANSCAYNLQIGSQQLEINLPKETDFEAIKKIMSFSGLPTNFDIYSSRINNAAAVIIKNKRYIIYDPRLFQYVENTSNSYWTSISIIAHEIGHHLSGHTLESTQNQQMAELEADKFSGFVLYKMGANEDEVVLAMTSLGGEHDSESHPNKYRRIEAILQGWKDMFLQYHHPQETRF